MPAAIVERLDRIPGVNRTTIENVIAEIGVDMTVFPDEHHLASWAGVCPGNEESAGKRLRSRTRKGNRWLRRALVEAAWAASQAKDSYLAAQYRRLAARRGKKRALVAVGHSLLVIIYHVLRHEVEYRGPGTGLLRPAGAGAAAALSGQAPASARLRRDADASKPRRQHRLVSMLATRENDRARGSGRIHCAQVKRHEIFGAVR